MSRWEDHDSFEFEEERKEETQICLMGNTPSGSLSH